MQSTLADLSIEINDYQKEVREFAEGLKGSVSGLGARLDELEQKFARGGLYTGSPGRAIGGAEGGSLGAIVSNSAELRDLLGKPGRRGTAAIGVPASTVASITTAVGSGGAMLTVDRRNAEADVVPGPRRRLTVRGLMGSSTTTSSAVEYAREFGFSNAAATVSEGARKPESDIDYELVSAPVRKIAHFVKVSQEALRDGPALQNVVDTTLRYGLSLVEEAQLLYGDGVSPNHFGIIPQATAFSRAFVPEAPNRIDDLGLALLQCELALFPANGIVMHPTDWRRLTMTKDANFNYLLGAGPGTATPPMLWGLDVVPTPAIAEGYFLVGAFALGATIFDREEANVQISTENEDDFVRNRATILAENRFAFAVKRPASFVYGHFQTTT